MYFNKMYDSHYYCLTIRISYMAEKFVMYVPFSFKTFRVPE